MDTLRALVAAAQSASTSSNLHTFSIISVDEKENRQRMYELCSEQMQVLNASRFLVFCADHHRLRESARKFGESCEGLDYLEFYTMAVIDASLAAERLFTAAEAHGISGCYIGAARNHADKMSEELSLPNGVFALFGLCLGYPDENSKAEIKPRMGQQNLWFSEKYPAQVSTEEYDERMRGFYERQKMKTDETWTEKSAKRVDGAHMTGREILLPFLQSRGFIKR